MTHAQIDKLLAGDIGIMKDLPPSSKQKVAALTTKTGRGELEKVVGPTTDFVPIAFLESARTAATSVARIIDSKRQGLGTGVMVSRHLLLTNNHVIANPETASRCSVQFNYELGADGLPENVTEFRFDPARFFCTSHEDKFDYTLIAIGETVAGDQSIESFGWIAMSSAGDKHAEGDHVTLVEHPEGDFKQIALRDNRVIGRGKNGVTLHYSADTLGGASGSPVFNDEFALVALHHAGGWRNDDTLEGDVPVPEDSNEGIRISTIVNDLRGVHDEMPPGPRDLLAETLNPPAPAPLPATGASHLEAAANDPTVAVVPAASAIPLGGVVAGDLRIPQLHITQVGPTPVTEIRAVEPAIATVEGAVLIAAPPTLERNDAPEGDYKNRGGYDPDFLGRRLATPTIPDDVLDDCAKPNAVRRRTTANVALKYHHFSVVVRADRRMPLFTIVNIDGRKLRSINRKTGVVEAAETWFVDSRIAASEQLEQPIFDAQRPRIFDRGHMVRRLDPAWGSPSAAKFAADDTFHFTNCCPQLLAFNQHLWQGIENYALDNARDEKKRITVITGPVFGADDPEFRGIKVPRRFWKIVARIHEGDLRATGFLADHGEALDAALARLEAFTDPSRVAVFQKSIADIETASGLGFATLRSKDSLIPGLESADTPLDQLDDISW